MLVDALIALRRNMVCNNNGLRSLTERKRSRAQALLFALQSLEVYNG